MSYVSFMLLVKKSELCLLSTLQLQIIDSYLTISFFNINSLRRIRSIADANPTLDLEECVIQFESRKTIKSRVYLIIQTFLHNVDCVRDVHKTLKGLILRETLGVLAVEVCCDELRSTIDRELSVFFLRMKLTLC